ncbi:MAG: prenyltransferase/squalene oxidase repeat-containing protein [Rubripirellula sp.]
MNQPLLQRTRATLDRLRQELIDERGDERHWTGTLSPSALSTATAVSAMSAVVLHTTESPPDPRLMSCIEKGIAYLSGQQNDDGGYGDTDRSHSNIATSYLVLAATSLAQQATDTSSETERSDRLKAYLDKAGGIDALRRRYGKDKTFVVPILTNMAIAGLVPWDDVAALPFEAAVFPQSMYRLLQMPVVSYAIPALVAIGQARHFHGRKAFAPLRWIRGASIHRTMNVLRRMQPQSGGYLEATPLTSFVVMSLAATKRGDCEVSRLGLKFLMDSMDSDGSWPIDTNLATWVTSLAIHALRCDPNDDRSWVDARMVQWHLSCQHRVRHPFTGAEPGGWGWSDLSGAVPDSDDTPAAILALSQLRNDVDRETSTRCEQAMSQGQDWLSRLQNRDGGWPTFCRGWGKLPFDRSSNDLTAHALRALSANADPDPDRRTQKLQASGKRFLERNQEPDGSWLPLWFGNQDRDDESNPIYGTSRVLLAAASGHLTAQATEKGCAYLVQTQNQDGGWGGGPSVTEWLKQSTGREFDVSSSIEETALAVEALSTILLSRRNSNPRNGVQGGCVPAEIANDGTGLGTKPLDGGTAGYREAIIRGIDFLLRSVDDERHRVPWPIGFYFAKLWYHERLYPLIFSVAALGKYLRLEAEDFDPDWPR